MAKLTETQLVALTRIALAKDGTVGGWGNALQDAGVAVEAAVWLASQHYLETVSAKVVGGSLPYYRVTPKGRQALTAQFAG